MTGFEQTATGRLRMAAADTLRFGLIALIAFLTLVDLFAAQAILPSLVVKFDVSRATMGFAVNASTFGMAVAGLLTEIEDRLDIVIEDDEIDGELLESYGSLLAFAEVKRAAS